MPKKSKSKKYKLYYFAGRNTGIAATSAANARKKIKRAVGGKKAKLIGTRTPKPGEMKGGKWSRIRLDGKSPSKSKYGKGRGQGPPRKKKR